MPREVAPAFLHAAAEAWPFTAEAAFRRCTLHFTRTRGHLYDTPTQHLADDLEAWLRPRAAGLSLDVLHRVIDRAWFDGAPAYRPLVAVLTDLAERTLEAHGPTVILCRNSRRDADLGQRLAHFRWLSLLLPPDLLVAALSAARGVEPRTDRVCLLTPQLAAILAEPVAETHVHLGAALSFSLLWSSLLSSLGHDPPELGKLGKGPEPTPFGDAPTFLAMLLAAAIGRILIASFLWQRERTGSPAGFSVFLHRELSNIAARMIWTESSDDAELALRNALRALAKGVIPPYFRSVGTVAVARLSRLYGALLALPQVPTASTLIEVHARDPLSAWLTSSPGLALPETRFAARAITYLRGPGALDNDFACLFWQYQRVRGRTYQHLVQQPGTAGLGWFQRHYDRISPLRKSIEGAMASSALDLEASDLPHGLAALEVRTAPTAAWHEVRDEVRRVARAGKALADHRNRGADVGRSLASATLHASTEIGLTLHFLKQREACGIGGRRLHADPDQPAHGVRYGAWAYSRLQEALAIKVALDSSPELLLVLRGLDIASTELAIPTWAAIPFFHLVRGASLRASERLACRLPDWRVPPLRVTCHAGEDYTRLPEGLRRVHELIEFDVIGTGDRIGHGLSLGHDPQRWARGAAEIPQPAEERLDDLLWELDRYARGDFGVDSGRYAHARAEAARIARNIYGDPDLDLLLEARRLRHDPRVLNRIGYPFLHRVPPPIDPVERLVYRHLTETGVFRRGQRLEIVRPSADEVSMLQAAQTWLCREIARLEITVETNPSSNLLLGDMLALEEHPSFRLAPLPGAAVEGRCPVLLSVNADDPLCFATSIADEMAYLYGALLRSGIADCEALTWLAARREQGYRSRFTLPASAESEALGALLP